MNVSPALAPFKYHKSLVRCIYWRLSIHWGLSHTSIAIEDKAHLTYRSFGNKMKIRQYAESFGKSSLCFFFFLFVKVKGDSLSGDHEQSMSGVVVPWFAPINAFILKSPASTLNASFAQQRIQQLFSSLDSISI